MTTMFASFTTRAATEMVRHHPLIAILTLGACATIADVQAIIPSDDLAIAIIPSRIQHHPAVTISITNRSSAPVCILTETLQNPWSNNIRLRLQDSRSRNVKLYPAHGSSEPQLDGTVRLEPGMTTQGQLHLERFRRIGGRRPLPRGWRIQAQIPHGNCQPREDYCEGRFGLCPDAWSRLATSTWQPLSFTNSD